jgi:hypothetical protein
MGLQLRSLILGDLMLEGLSALILARKLTLKGFIKICLHKKFFLENGINLFEICLNFVQDILFQLKTFFRTRLPPCF